MRTRKTKSLTLKREKYISERKVREAIDKYMSRADNRWTNIMIKEFLLKELGLEGDI